MTAAIVEKGGWMSASNARDVSALWLNEVPSRWRLLPVRGQPFGTGACINGSDSPLPGCTMAVTS